MFFKKRRDAKKAAVEEARQVVLKDLQDRFDAAQKCPDAGERFLKLEEIRDFVDVVVKQMKGEAAEGAVEKGQFALLGTMSAGTAAALAVVSFSFPPLLGLVAIAGGLYGGVKAGRAVVQSSYRHHLAQNRTFIEALEGQKIQAAEAADALLENRLRDMAASPRFDELVEKAPRVREHFMKAYGRKIAEEDQKAGRNPPKPPQDSGFRL
ncbi:MAG: hypothetical protein EPN97_17960 [Alphaproteobacteria bacterium]|nr:MAG: hypothetical protein EPN97_17960 [Alphaproteobacteria bacterium]